MPGRRTQQSARNSTDNSASRTQRNIVMAIKNNATSVGHTNSMVYRVFSPTSAEVLLGIPRSGVASPGQPKVTIGPNTTIRELLEQLGILGAPMILVFYYSDNGNDMNHYPVTTGDNLDNKAISTIWSKRYPLNLPHIPVTEERKITIFIIPAR